MKKNIDSKVKASTSKIEPELLLGTSGDDRLNGGIGDQLIRGLAGNDILNGLQGNDRLEGGDGDDWLSGGNGKEGPFYNGELHDIGEDYLDGGKGDDRLSGGLGADTYVWGKGYGNDIVEERNFDRESYASSSNYSIQTDEQVTAANTSYLKLVNLKPNDVEFSRDESFYHQQFIMRIKSTGETLTWQGTYGITDINIEFANGVKWNTADLQARLFQGTNADDVLIGFRGARNTLHGGNGQDFMMGGQHADILKGGKGNDDIVGDSGADIIKGGAGFDVIDGGEGADQYQFGWGSDTDVLISSNISLFGSTPISNHNDSIILTKGIRTKDVSVLRNGDSLIIQLNGSNDRFEVDGFFKANGTARDDTFKLIFNDGTQWGGNALAEKAVIETLRSGVFLQAAEGQQNIAGTQNIDVLVGNDSANTLYGRGGDDVFDSKGGNDNLYGGAGKDTFILARGTGHDVVHDVQNDIIRVATGLKPEDIEIVYGSGSVDVRIKDTYPSPAALGDSVTLENFLLQHLAAGHDGTIIQFADGTVWTQRQIQADQLNANDDDNHLEGTDADDCVDGKGGNDNITGHAGNDILHGGEGGDYIYGGTGNDIIYADGGEGNSLSGGLGDDLLVGSDNSDFLAVTEGGNDRVIAGGGDDIISGDYGDDYYDGGTGNDTIDDYSGLTTIALKGEFGQDVFRGVDITNGGVILELDGKVADYIFQVNPNEIIVKKGENQLTINGSNALGSLREIHFGDGTHWQGQNFGDGFANHLLSTGATAGKDELKGTELTDTIGGGGGDDIIFGEGGDDVLYGGDGNDRITGSGGDELIFGGAGDDVLYGQGGYNRIFGGSGNDSIVGTGVLSGDGGNDTLKSLEIGSEPYADWIIGGSGDDVLMGGKGEDTYSFNDNFGIDNIWDDDQYSLAFSGNASDFNLSLNDAGNLIVDYGLNKVTVNANLRSEFGLQAIGFRDGSLDATGIRIALGLEEGINQFANQILSGSESFDFLNGGFGDDTLTGMEGDDVLFGGSGDDSMNGGDGNDRLLGGTGNDYLIGGKGDDILEGGDGINTYEINSNEGHDIIDNSGQFILMLDDGIGLEDLTASFVNDQIKLQLSAEQSITFNGDPAANLLKIVTLSVAGQTFAGLEAANLINSKLQTPLTGLDNQADMLAGAMASFATPATSLSSFSPLQDTSIIHLSVEA